MEKIYLLEDCNGLKYVGRTKQNLFQTYAAVSDMKRGNCSSGKLDLENANISWIDVADCEEDARELEEFHINSIDCVNKQKLNFDKKEWKKEYRVKNKEEINRKIKEYRSERRQEFRAKAREHYAENAIKKMQKEALLGE
tara:strand:- start:30 stop:449 length:420 start_codon:yes stop_codon:yes gene_type:complete